MDLGREIEDLLTRIPSVSAARVVVEGTRVAEVHLVTDRTRAPKQIVRDVQSVVLAGADIEIDYRTISIVQLDDPAHRGSGGVPAVSAVDPAPGSAAAAPGGGGGRVELASVVTDVRNSVTEVRIEVRADGNGLAGVARGPSSAWERLVARAVVDAVQALTASVAEVEDVRVVEGTPRVALVNVCIPSPRGDVVVSGSAPVRGDTGDAIARATLSALNRFVRAT